MRTAHRIASRAKRDVLDMPKFWRPKLTESLRTDALLVHWELIDRFSNGTADQSSLWDWMECGFTYSQVMHLHQEDGTDFTDEAIRALAEQLETYPSICERYRRTGRVGFSPSEYLIAKAAGAVMDSLLEIDRHGIALQAAMWSEKQMAKIKASPLLRAAA